MQYPSLALVPGGQSRDRQGVVEPEVAGIAGEVVQTDAGAAWTLWRGLGPNASLLLSPDGSFDADGPVEPTIVGDVQVVTGQYGQAWSLPNAPRTTNNVSLPFAGQVTVESGTVLARAVIPATSQGAYPVSSGYTSGLLLGMHSTGYLNGYLGDVQNIGSGAGAIAVPNDTHVVLGLVWDFEDAALYLGGIRRRSALRADPPTVNFGSSVQLIGDNNRAVVVESAVFFDDRVPDADIARIATMPRRWEWGPDTTLRANLATLPASLLIRATEDDITTTHHVTGLVEDVPATFGDHGTVTYSDGELIIGTTRNTDVVGVLAYPDELTPGEVHHLESLPFWSWASVTPRFGDIQYIPRPSPVTVRYQPRPSPIAIGYQPRPSPIAIGYEIRTTPEDD